MHRIMIVEDEAISVLFLRSTLERMAHEVVGVADNGEDAIAMAAREKPDVVLMDTRLRSRMGGIEAANQIRAESGIRAIFISAYSRQEIEHAYAYPDEFLLISKPVIETELAAALDKIMPSRG